MDRTAVTSAGGRSGQRRQRWVAAVLAAPVISAALGVCAVEGWRIVRPRSPLFAPPFAYSLGEAIAAGNVPHAYEYVRAGQNPNELIAVQHPGLTQGRWVLVSPLLWSVALGNPEAVKMLIGYGARLDRPADRQAICLAEALGHAEIARILRTYDGLPSAAPCGDFARDRAPLLRVLAAAESERNPR